MRILLIGGWNENFSNALSLGCQVTGFVDPSARTLVKEEVARACSVTEVNIRDVARCLHESIRLHQVEPFSGVFSFTEFGLETASVIARALELPGAELHPNVLTRNKELMREALAGSKLDNVGYRVCSNAAELDEFAKSRGLPIILKPTNGQGSVGIRLVHDRTELKSVLSGENELLWPMLAETFINGQEYSVEAVSVAGNHHIVAITEKSLNSYFVEIQHLVPAPIDREIERGLHDATITLLNAVGLQTGVSHSEFRVAQDQDGNVGIFCIETQLRPGGGRIWKLVEICTGLKMDKMVMASSLGLNYRHGSPSARCALSYFPMFPPGKIAKVEGLEVVRSSAGVELFEFDYKTDDIIEPLITSAKRKSCLVVSGKDREEALVNRDTAISFLQVEIEEV